MTAQDRNPLVRLAAAVLFALATFPAAAHQAESAQPVVTNPNAVTATGTVAELTVENQLTGVTRRYFELKVDHGGSYALNGIGLDALSDGSRINATGTVAGNVFNVTLFGVVAQVASATRLTARAQTRKSITGVLAVYHKDFFDQGRGEYGLAIRDASGQITLLNVATIPDSLEIGMLITVDGTLAADESLDASSISILASGPAQLNDVAGAPVTNTVLVIPIRFSNTPAGDPWNAAAINTEFQTKVAPYYQEVSYGQQLLNISVACTTAPVAAGCAGKTDANGWLKSASPTPVSCDFTAMATLADAVATAAGYDVSVTQRKFVYYVLPAIPACGWAGLAYIGWGHAWSNGVNALWVYGHELGHNFGLWHAGSLSCSGQVLGGTCSVGEYGDPFDVMGNIEQMHFNAMQKSALSWIPATSVKTHTTGTATYTLSPLESSGQSTYAIKIPAAANRTYWIEYRQPIGVDSRMSLYPNNGAQIRVASPFQFPCSNCGGNDTQLLDMTLGTPGSFGDAALLVGQTYTDSTYGVSVHVISATPSALTLSVSASGSSPPAALQSAVSRKVHGAAGTFNLPLLLAPVTNPTTEPRQGSTQTIVFTFDKPITAATATVSEGTATAAAPTFSGNDVTVNLTGVTNLQYVTVALSNVASADGATGGAGSVRIGFLLGDVNQSRSVTVADVGLVNAALAQPVTVANYLKDVNASGTLSVADKALINSKLTSALPAP